MNRNELITNIVSNIHNGVFVEIGTHEGMFAELILNNSVGSNLYCIDPYIKYNEYEDAINNITGDNLYNKVYHNLKTKYGKRVEIIRDFSNKAVNSIPDNIDFLYIDGNHQYKYVIDDLNNYYSKVKNGGIIVGDDAVDFDENLRNKQGDVYIEWCIGCYGKYGVIKAFNDFFIDKNDERKIIGNQYYVKKMV